MEADVIARWRWGRVELLRAFLRALLFQRALIGLYVVIFVIPGAVLAALKSGTYLVLALFPLLLLIAIVGTVAAASALLLRKVPTLKGETSMSISEPVALTPGA